MKVKGTLAPLSILPMTSKDDTQQMVYWKSWVMGRVEIRVSWGNVRELFPVTEIWAGDILVFALNLLEFCVQQKNSILISVADPYAGTLLIRSHALFFPGTKQI